MLARLPPKSVHCVVTSPPYWGLRDYGTGTWEGGDPECSHDIPRDYLIAQTQANHRLGGLPRDHQIEAMRAKLMANGCPSCGARRVDNQLGNEDRPDCLGWATGNPCGECFVCHIVQVFRQVRRVLRDDGTLWLNLGDTYAGGGGGNYGDGKNARHGGEVDVYTSSKKLPLSSGNLVGVPWRCALALQADGWVLRSDVIWHKPSPMPESVTNRCTKAHEYVFQFTKSMRYYCDMDAVREGAKYGRSVCDHGAASLFGRAREGYPTDKRANPKGANNPGDGGDRNKRDVWTVDDHRALLEWLGANHPQALTEYLSASTEVTDVWRVASAGYPGAHFATFPPKLVEPCVLAGTSAAGCCGRCGTPYNRVTEETALTRDRPNEYVKRTGEPGTGNSCANTVAGVSVKTLGWRPGCECFGTLKRVRRQLEDSDYGAEWEVAYTPSTPLEDHPVRPCTVLDPFFGSGTVGEVCLMHGRHSIGIELSARYVAENAVPRVKEALYAAAVARNPANKYLHVDQLIRRMGG